MENKDFLMKCLRNVKLLFVYFLNIGFFINFKYGNLDYDFS